jgi:hypothetical protein
LRNHRGRAGRSGSHRSRTGRAGLLAQVAIQKYADHLPLYRQEAIFARHGITLARSTLAEWLGHVGLRLQPLVDALRARLLTAQVLHADETPVAQLDPGAGKTKRAYLFAYRSPDPQPIVIFDYCPSRAGRHAADFLGPWRGALMVDDYGGYKALFAHGITELGCWAHARRKFFDAHKASGSPLAKEALQHAAKAVKRAIQASLVSKENTFKIERPCRMTAREVVFSQRNILRLLNITTVPQKNTLLRNMMLLTFRYQSP